LVSFGGRICPLAMSCSLSLPAVSAAIKDLAAAGWKATDFCDRPGRDCGGGA
jgi:hypothetical protein